MSTRITRKDLEMIFKAFVKSFNSTLSKSKKVTLHLEYIREYGGYKVIQREGPYAPEIDIFGSRRRTLGKMYDALVFATSVLERKSDLKRYNKQII